MPTFTEKIVKDIEDSILSTDYPDWQSVYTEIQEDGDFLLIVVSCKHRLTDEKLFESCKMLDSILCETIGYSGKDIKWICEFNYKGEMLDTCVRQIK